MPPLLDHRSRSPLCNAPLPSGSPLHLKLKSNINERGPYLLGYIRARYALSAANASCIKRSWVQKTHRQSQCIAVWLWSGIPSRAHVYARDVIHRWLMAMVYTIHAEWAGIHPYRWYSIYVIRHLLEFAHSTLQNMEMVQLCALHAR